MIWSAREAPPTTWDDAALDVAVASELRRGSDPAPERARVRAGVTDMA
jgi:hypothetical protein